MTEVSFDRPVGLPDLTRLTSAAERLVAIPDPDARSEAVLTVFKLLHGVLATPEDAKKRRLKKGNEVFNRKVGRYAAGVEFLNGCGFLDADDPDLGPDGKNALLNMRVAYMSRLTDAHHTLASVAQEAGITPPPLPGGGFNPYASSVSKMDTTRSLKTPQAYKSDAEALREEVKKRQRELQEKVDSAPPIALRPTVFWQSAGRRLEEVVRETADVAEEERGDNALLQGSLAGTKAALTGQNEKFMSADKKRLAELQRKRVHAFCIVRVVCPDKSVLQAHFRAADKGEHVLAQIGPLLSQGVQKSGWYIYQSPPMKRIAPRETLQSQGLTPGASMYLGFDGEKPSAPYFSSALVAQLGPAPEDARGASNPFSGEAMGWGGGQRLGAAPAATPVAGYSQSHAPMET